MLGAELMKRLGSQSTGGVDIKADTVKSTLQDITEIAVWKISNDGFTYKDRGYEPEGFVQSFSWIDPQVGMDQYDVRATLISGPAPPIGTLNTWLNLGTDRSWGYDPSDGYYHMTKLNVEIRNSSSGGVLDSAIITLIVYEQLNIEP